MSKGIITETGQSFPLGATLNAEGVNFSVFSRFGKKMELLLFDHADATEPSLIIELDPDIHRTFYYWHIFVPGLKAGQLYAFRCDGPFAPQEGHRFDKDKVLIDPYSRAVTGMNIYSREAAKAPGSNLAHCLKSVVIDPEAYDWEHDQPLNRPFSHSLIYEMHVGGFTKHESSGIDAQKRGTYAGLIEKIPYLKSLGITAVELQPVQQFDPYDAPTGHTNYWGYSPIAFFAPHLGYSSVEDPVKAVNEFKDMVKALHQAGIGVILDVVFNHTGENDEVGPTLSYRGLENIAYYILEGSKEHYANYSGCGNTLNANHSIVRRLIRHCLRAWVQEFHIDGFRFDLASILSRDEYGQPLENPPILWEIESDPVLAGTKIIAETWDAAGLYQLGAFIGDKWAEWNGQYRDDLRSFVKGDPGQVLSLAQRLTGSPDIYSGALRDPNRSINFITCHDGFTLNDLVSYNEKHNHANGEHNRDGHNENLSWNCGIEGYSEDPEVEGLRIRQLKNFMTLLLLSQGTPMMLMGDEVRRGQGGNNNAYCQDNEISWFDWSLLDNQAEFLAFVKELIAFTQDFPAFNQKEFWSDGQEVGKYTIEWHGTQPFQPDWSFHSRSLAYTLSNAHDKGQLYVMINSYWDDLIFMLPPHKGKGPWKRIIDTSAPYGHDISTQSPKDLEKEKSYKVVGRSVVVLRA